VAETPDPAEASSKQPARHQVPPGSLKARLADDQRAALKAGEKVRLSALRMLSAAITNREVELGRPISDDQFVEVATREVKRRKEAIEAFAAGGREDRAATERQEQQVLEAYIPAGLTQAEVASLIDEAFQQTGASGPGDMGKVMSYVMRKARGRVDGNAVQAAVNDRLGN
jgi:uncharacterized protein YqeY